MNPAEVVTGMSSTQAQDLLNIWSIGYVSIRLSTEMKAINFFIIGNSRIMLLLLLWVRHSPFLVNVAVNKAIALSIYDYLLTFELEIRHIWSRKFSGATLAFFLNRYGFLLFWILQRISGYSNISSVSVSSVISRKKSPFHLVVYMQA